MKNINIKNVAINEITSWTMQIIISVVISIVPKIALSNILEKWILYLILIFLTQIGAYIYYQKGLRTHGFILSIVMLIIHLILDTVISAPLFLQN